MTDIILPGRPGGGFHVATPASCFEEDKEIAWAAARERITPRPDIGWIIAKYVDLSTPESIRPNENGHIFMIGQGEAAYRQIVDTPLNWLHHDRQIVGHYVASEVMYHLPVGESVPVAALDDDPGAHIETLASFYRDVYPLHWEKVRDAHAEGRLWQSMEARPQSVTCHKEGCCGETFPFAGSWSDSYCASMQKPDREFILNDPYFIGGAVVVPPNSPGWRDASSLEVATYIETHQEEAERLFEQIHATHDGLDDEQAEAILVALLDAAGAGEGAGRQRTSMHSDGASFGWTSSATNGSGSSVTVSYSPPLAPLFPSFSLPRHEVASLLERSRAYGDTRWANVLEDQANHQGVIVALVPPPEIAQRLAEMGTETADQIHVTLAFIGDSGGLDTVDGPDGPVDVDQVNAAVAVFAASERPIKARMSGLGRFAAPGDSEVTYASIDAPGLNELRARLVEYLQAVGIPVDGEHGFTPHATLKYHRPGEGPTELPDELEWEVDGIELWWGDDMHAAHGFGGVDTPEQMAATLAIEAVASITTLDGAEGVAFEAFLAAARPEILQAVLDAGITAVPDVYWVSTGGQIDPALLKEHLLAAVAETLVDRMFSEQERRELAKQGQAMPNGGYPTPTEADWMNARSAIGRAKPSERAKVISYMKRRAKALGIPDEEIPDNW